MNRTTALVGALSLLLLGGAWFASRVLTADVVAPPAPVQALPGRLAGPSMEPGVPMPRLAQPLVPPAVVISPPAEPFRAPPPPPPPSSPQEELTGAQVEVNAIADKAAAQLKDLNGGTATWLRAEKAFERCLVLAPDDARCRAGVQEARNRLGPRPVKGPRTPTPVRPDLEE